MKKKPKQKPLKKGKLTEKQKACKGLKVVMEPRPGSHAWLDSPVLNPWRPKDLLTEINEAFPDGWTVSGNEDGAGYFFEWYSTANGRYFAITVSTLPALVKKIRAEIRKREKK